MAPLFLPDPSGRCPALHGCLCPPAPAVRPAVAEGNRQAHGLVSAFLLIYLATPVPVPVIYRRVSFFPGSPRPSAASTRSPVRCGFHPGSAADGHGTPASFNARVIRAALMPRQPLAEHPRHDGSRHRIRFQLVRPPSPCGVGLVRVRSRIGDPVPYAGGRPGTGPAPASARPSRSAPDPGPGNLPLGRQPSALIVCSWSSACQPTRPPTSGIHS